MFFCDRTQREVIVALDFLAVLLLLISAASLGPKLRKVHDVSKLSSEVQKVTGLMILVTGKYRSMHAVFYRYMSS